MNTEDLVTAIKEAFGQPPEDVLGPAKMAAKGFGWLNEILVSIQREAEGEKFSPRIVKLVDRSIKTHFDHVLTRSNFSSETQPAQHSSRRYLGGYAP